MVSHWIAVLCFALIHGPQGVRECPHKMQVLHAYADGRLHDLRSVMQ